MKNKFLKISSLILCFGMMVSNLPNVFAGGFMSKPNGGGLLPISHAGLAEQTQEASQRVAYGHYNRLTTSDEYVRFESPIEWNRFLGRLTTQILGINKRNLAANEWGIIVPLSDVGGAAVKSSEQIENEELLIRGVLENNVDMVRSALRGNLIDKNLLISVVTDQSKAQRFDVLQEARIKKNNVEIISLLRLYQTHWFI